MKMYTDHCLGLVLIQGIIVFWVLFCLIWFQWPTHTGGQHIPRHQGDFFGERGLLKGSSVHSADVIVDSKVGVFWFCMLITALFYNWVPIKIWKCTLGSFWEVVLTTAYILFYLCFAVGIQWPLPSILVVFDGSHRCLKHWKCQEHPFVPCSR